jgi:hypothetical protein
VRWQLASLGGSEIVPADLWEDDKSPEAMGEALLSSQHAMEILVTSGLLSPGFQGMPAELMRIISDRIYYRRGTAASPQSINPTHHLQVWTRHPPPVAYLRAADPDEGNMDRIVFAEDHRDSAHGYVWLGSTRGGSIEDWDHMQVLEVSEGGIVAAMRHRMAALPRYNLKVRSGGRAAVAANAGTSLDSGLLAVTRTGRQRAALEIVGTRSGATSRVDNAQPMTADETISLESPRLFLKPRRRPSIQQESHRPSGSDRFYPHQSGSTNSAAGTMTYATRSPHAPADEEAVGCLPSFVSS